MATAPAPAIPTHPPLPERPRTRNSLLIKVGVGVAIAALLVLSWINTQASVTGFIDGLFGSKGLFRSIIGPNLPGDWSATWEGIRFAYTTLCIAILSMFFGVIYSLLLVPFAARNLAPNRLTYRLTRFVLAFLRSVPELIMLLLFLATVGLTPFSAVIALSFHGIGVIAKLYAEAVEEMEMAPIEALRVAGASRLQVYLHAVLPGVRTTLVGLTLYRFDANFRSAVTLGAVGGGGIGFLIDNAVNAFEFKVVLTYIIIMVVFVMAIERVSEIARARLT